MKIEWVRAGEIEIGDMIAGEVETHGGVFPRRDNAKLWPRIAQVDDIYEVPPGAFRRFTLDDERNPQFNNATELMVIRPETTWVQDIKKILAGLERSRKVKA